MGQLPYYGVYPSGDFYDNLTPAYTRKRKENPYYEVSPERDRRLHSQRINAVDSHTFEVDEGFIELTRDIVTYAPPGRTDDLELPAPCWPGSIRVLAYSTSRVPNVVELLKDVHYSLVLDADDLVTALQPLIQWPASMTLRVEHKLAPAEGSFI
jgi:hypothetical protein